MSRSSKRFAVPQGTKKRLVYLLVLAVVAVVLPIPFALSFLRPELIALWVLFIAYIYSYQVSLILVFFLGLAQGFVEGAVFGAHALALIFIAVSTANVARRLRGGSEVQRLLWVILMVASHQGLLSWIFLIADRPSASVANIVIPALLTAAFWMPLSRWLKL